MRVRRDRVILSALGVATHLALFSTTALAGLPDSSPSSSQSFLTGSAGLANAGPGNAGPGNAGLANASLAGGNALAAPPLFDAPWYLATNPDVARAGMDPLAHYQLFGWREGRSPHAMFDVAYYLARNPDVRAAGIDPLTHFLEIGWRQGRNPNADFNMADYLRLNPDVAASGMNPLLHYALYGQAQRRAFASSPQLFRTAEFTANYGLDQVRAAQAYTQGATGAGVTVAVIDSGIDIAHPDLTGQFAGGGYDFYNKRAGATDNFGHGTSVAGVIAAKRNGTGTQGVAYNARLLPVGVFGAGGRSGTASDFAQAFNYAVAQGARVVNGSFTSVGRIITPASAVEFDAILAAARAGMVMVFAAGNYGEAHPSLPGLLPYVSPDHHAGAQMTGIYNFAGVIPMNDWSGTMGQIIAVVAVDQNNQIAPFSNRCGVAAAWCLAAPGVNIQTTLNGGGYGAVSGTSFSAPHVSGAVAVLMQMWPHLTSRQVVELLLSTATPLGTVPGRDPVYGRGLLNLERATQPQGTAMVALGSSVDGPAAPLALSSVQLSPAFGDALAGLDLPVGFLDGFGRSYLVGLGNLVQPAARTSAFGAMLGFGRPEPGVIYADKTMRLAMTAAPPPRPAGPADTGRNDPGFQIGSLAFSQTFRSGQHLHFAYGIDPRANPGLRGENGLRPQDLPLGTGVGIPYLAMAQERSLSLSTEMPLGSTGLSLRNTAFLGSPASNDPVRLNPQSRNRSGVSGETVGAVSELRYTGSTVSLGVHAGLMSESDGPLGLRTDGAFALAGSTPTWFAGVSGQVELGSGVSLFGSYHIGLSQPTVAGTGASLVTDLSNLRSSSFSLGIAGRDVLREKDRLGFVFSQPLRVDGASASFSLPLGRDLSGNVIRHTFRENLAPQGRELNAQLFYHAELDTGTTASVGLFTRFQPDNRADAKTEGGLMMRLRHSF